MYTSFPHGRMDRGHGDGGNVYTAIHAQLLLTFGQAMKTVGIERFIAASSDNTGNTRGFRRIICERIPTMLNLPDPNHHLNNTMKDVLKLLYFKLVRLSFFVDE